MNKDIIDKKNIANIMVDEILEFEKKFVKEIDQQDKEAVTKLTNKFEEVYKNYDSKKIDNK